MAMGFMFYDLIFLAIFIFAMVLFLIKNKHKVKSEGPLMFLYRTSVGLKLINELAAHKKLLKWLSYVIIVFGYVLMAFSIYLVYNLVTVFLKPGMMDIIRIPPLAPLIPYLPEIFHATWLPPFYATYWIVILALVAIFHEGAHGILARYNKVKIKSTGFGFFWPLLSLLFFVEQDDKDMNKKKISSQLAIIAAGVFANLVLAFIFFFVMVGFFSLSYHASGVIFNDYSYAVAPASAILGAVPVMNDTLHLDGTNLTKISLNNASYFVSSNFFSLKNNISSDTLVKIYADTPALRENIVGAITKINSQQIHTKEELAEVLSSFKPGEAIFIQTTQDHERTLNFTEYKIKLASDPSNSSRAVIGIAISKAEITGFKGIIYRISNTFKDPNAYYTPKMWFSFTAFIYHLLQWLFLINVSVAVANMIPAGIFDGGRFFYLTILRLTGNKRVAERLFKAATWIFVGVLIFLTLIWARWFILLLFK